MDLNAANFCISNIRTLAKRVDVGTQQYETCELQPTDCGSTFILVFLLCPLHLLADLSSVSLWSVNKKKPLSTVKQAHGCHGDAGLEQPHWVASVAALQNSDAVASGASGCESPYQLLNRTHMHIIMSRRNKDPFDGRLGKCIPFNIVNTFHSDLTVVYTWVKLWVDLYFFSSLL